MLPPLDLDRISPLLDRLGGVLLSGGPDLDPAAYGRAAHPELGRTEPQLDVFEVELPREADARGLPILGICRGAQALNIARGGTLHQHLPEITDGSIVHRQSQPGSEATHEVRIAPDSGLAAVVGCARMDVNSFHHQSVERLGDGLHAVAWAQDGVIEGIEGRESACCWAFSGTPRRWSTTPRSSHSSDTWWQPPRSESESGRPAAPAFGATSGLSGGPAGGARAAQPGAAGRHPRNGGRGPSGSRRR